VLASRACSTINLGKRDVLFRVPTICSQSSTTGRKASCSGRLPSVQDVRPVRMYLGFEGAGQSGSTTGLG
jgi:hypothetical protein